MRLSRIITALVAGLVVAGTPTVAGAAQPYPPQPSYPPQPPSLTVNPATINLGRTTTIVGLHFGRNEVVDIVVSRSPLYGAGVLDGRSTQRDDGGTVAMVPVAYEPLRQPTDPDTPPQDDPLEATTDSQGRFKLKFKPHETGNYTLVATGRYSNRSATAHLTVLKPQPQLPVTGTDVGTSVGIGVGLVAVGAFLLMLTFAWRRRSRVVARQ
ncbi:hypothetical protein GCM10027280_42300 [Micromonospora polyrhachis]|uniref:LPXTG-motif cell wall anchor domain-containing protein n=1 Tax=Micromonospora polyrhachis TaxID=1282883 RepID=A0A7W7WSE8_9ACTN|nr:hypothetical protein [Micromonospora polyrhachis]MBB4962045.1 hypothetical protein [Micromonospora polyrhachis]